MDERFDGTLRHALSRTGDHYVPKVTSSPYFRCQFPGQGINTNQSHGVQRNTPVHYQDIELKRRQLVSRRCRCAN